MSIMPLPRTSSTAKKAGAVSPQKGNVEMKTKKTPVKEERGAGLTEFEKEDLITQSRLKARKLARSILRKWNARLDLQEVDSIVDLSLCEAAHRFDPSVGASFMTFLFYHLRGNLIRSITASANSNVLPALDAEMGSYDDEGSDTGRSSYKSTNAAEIAEALNGQDSELPDEALIQKEMLDLSRGARGKLDDLAREVLDRIYLQEEQLIDIACSLGYSRCHISRVKKRALETLFDELKTSLSIEGSRPSFDEEEGQQAPLRTSDRKKIHRRRPRSKTAQIGIRAGVIRK